MKEKIKTIIAGVLIGVANTIPGLSGGTMAVILDMYDKILNATSLKNIKANIGFLLLLALGGGLGILGFSNVIIILLDNFSMVMNFIFIGLIFGSLPLLIRHAKESSSRIKPVNFIFTIATFTLMIYLTFAQSTTISNQSLEEMGGVTFGLLAYIFIASFVSAIAMLLPGISGSLLLLIFGVYAVIIQAVGTLNFIILAPVALGVGLGVLIGIKLIRELLNRFPQPIYFGILGLMVGSVFPIWPGFKMGLEGIVAIILALAFALLSYFSGKGSKKN